MFRYGLAALVVVLDQLTKWWAVANIDPLRPIPVIDGFFNLVLRYNTGAAFSFLSDAGGWQRWLFVGIAVVFSVILIVWLARLTTRERWQGLGLALVLGGALGNLIDRVLAGRVTDFIEWYWRDFYWPAFNVADSAILVGLVMFVLAEWRASR